MRKLHREGFTHGGKQFQYLCDDDGNKLEQAVEVREVEMNKYDIKAMVRDGKQVTFQQYDGIKEEFIYKTECGFEFPVPVSEAKGAVFLPEDKAMLFMRYIRKHIKYLAAE